MDIRPDEEWRGKLSRRDRILTSVLTGPMLVLHRAAVRRDLLENNQPSVGGK